MAQSTASLRAVTYRLSSTPTQQLPGITPQIAGSLWTCKDILSLSTESKATGEAATAVHRFKTQLNTLLQDRTIEGRWAAVVLTKATIEAGGLEVLSKSNQWVKHLLGILKRPDPPTTRNLVVLALTRIFMLTWDYANLIREITTPALTAFIPSCISNIENKRCTGSELQTVLEAFATLLPRHPTIFRQNESKIRSILTIIISSTSTSVPERHYSDAHRAAAAKLLVLLHHCAPKQGGSDKWQEAFKAAVGAAHATCDQVFRAVHEDWQSVVGVTPSAPGRKLLNGELEMEEEDAAGLKPWEGIYGGAERLVALIHLLISHLATATSTTMTVRIGILSDLLTRLYGVVVPSQGKQEFVKINNQISKDEREALFNILPPIHFAAIKLSRTLIKRFGSSTIAGHHATLNQLLYVFQAESSDPEIRSAAYELLTGILERLGPAMGRTEIGELVPLLKTCCTDLLPDAKDGATAPKTNINGQARGIKQQLGMAGAQIAQSSPTDQGDLPRAAQALLRTALLRIEALPAQLRTLIDRTAALTRNHQLLQASVMNPPPKKSASGSVPASLLPILAREFGDTAEVDVLLRPRLPVIGMKAAEQSNGYDEEDDEENDEEDDDENDGVPGEAEGEAANDGREDPTIGLLDALGHNASLEPAALKASTTLFTSDAAAMKRRATEDVADTTAKRLRPSSEALLAAEVSTVAEPSSTTSRAVMGVASNQTTAMPTSSAPTVASYHTAIGGDSDDDSDFEIPEIHVDDSEDEE